MKSLLAFIKKETMEQFRSGRLMILGILFVLLGVMNDPTGTGTAGRKSGIGGNRQHGRLPAQDGH